MKKALLLLLFLPFYGYAQKDSINMDVKLNFFTPFDVFTFPTLDLSLEQRITNNISISAEGGVELYHFSPPDTSFIDAGGYKLRAETRFYHPFASYERRHSVHTSLTGFYLGLDFFYRQEKYNSSVEFMNSGTDTTVYIDNYWTEKKATGSNLIIGYQWTPFRRVVADGYLGIGMLHRTITRHELNYTESEGVSIVDGREISSFFARRDLSEKSGQGLSLAFGIRIGFVIY